MLLACGEALIDMLPRQSTEGEDAFAPYCGGAVLNTAIALGRLGAPTGFLSGISTDLFGAKLTESLDASGVDHSLAIRFDRPTTLAFVTLRDGQAQYAFYDEGTAGRMLSPGDLPELPDAVEALYFGSISLVPEPCGGTYEALMLAEAPRRVTMIDPNVRPSFIKDEAAYRGRIERMFGAADIVKLSDEDIHWLYGEGAIADLAARIMGLGPKLVCVTEGAKGAHGFTANHSLFAPAKAVAVVDTVGAGDTFNAAILAALHREGLLTKPAIAALSAEQILAALTFGTKAAAVTVGRAGANPPWAHEL